jgi:gamma-glutamyltranspeptidase / glutathione hydrolase
MINKYYTKVGRTSILLLVAGLCFFTACRQPQQPPYKIVQSATAGSAMVVAGHPLAAKVGAEIMKAGGNAVDAAIATQFALAVVHPRAGNIGGGGFMVIRLANGEKAALDYREEAPAAAHRDMYLDSLDNVIPGISREGHLSVGVPGTVAGMAAAFEKYSRLKDWKELLQPAIDLADNGYAITESEADRLNYYQDIFLKNNVDGKPFVTGGEWNMGGKLVQKDLARTLERIRDEGLAGFYEGETANLLVAEMQRGNGLITFEDLKNYRVKWKAPIEGDYKEYHVITMPPSSSGGIALVQLLTILENYPLSYYGFQSAEAVHAIAEAERRVFADRAKFLGDDDFYPVPEDTLLDEHYLASRMTDFNPAVATRSDSVQSGNFSLRVESFETTHTSVIDGAGNAVSVTTTLNLNYGSKVIVAGAGFFLNDEMDDFSAKPGVPNYFGLIGAGANAIEPGKRMLSSMTPTIVEKNGRLFMAVGAPGGSTIITAVLQTILNVTDFGMSMEDAVTAPRFHHQWLPDEIRVEEKAIDTLIRKELWDMGHHLRAVDRMAVIKAIQVMPDGTLSGAGDWRNPDDHVEGY